MIKLVFPGAAMEAPKCCSDACNCQAPCYTVQQGNNGETYTWQWCTAYNDIGWG